MPHKVFAMGNALVDYEYKVTDKDLLKTGITKGSAKLVHSVADQKALFALLENGDATFVKKANGGSAANTMFAISALGGTSSFSFCVSDDEAGQFYLEDLKSSGVESSVDSCVQSEQSTGSCIVMVSEDAERTMQAHLGISAEVNFDCVNQKLLQDTAFVYVEGYLCSHEASVDAVLKVQDYARTNNIKIALSFADPSVVTHSKPAVHKMLAGGVDVLFCNEEEASVFTGEADLKKATSVLHNYSDLVVVTLGKDGAFISKKQENSFETFQVAACVQDKVVDTNGAGDNFAGAFMYGLTHGMDLQTSAELAVHIAGELVSYFGPRMQKQDYITILEKFKKQKNI